MTPSAIVFDFDGTVADTEWPIYSVARDAYRSHGLDMTLESWVQLIGLADNGTLESMLTDALGRPPDPEVIERAGVERAQHREAVAPLPGVVDVIGAARQAEIPLAVASSSSSDWVESHLEQLALSDFFVAVRTRDHVDRGKPAPDVYLAASAALGVDPGEILAIEDSRHGCRAAKTAGMTCVVVPNRITALDVPTDADLVLESLADFPFGHFGLPVPSG